MHKDGPANLNGSFLVITSIAIPVSTWFCVVLFYFLLWGTTTTCPLATLATGSTIYIVSNLYQCMALNSARSHYYDVSLCRAVSLLSVSWRFLIPNPWLALWFDLWLDPFQNYYVLPYLKGNVSASVLLFPVSRMLGLQRYQTTRLFSFKWTPILQYTCTMMRFLIYIIIATKYTRELFWFNMCAFNEHSQYLYTYMVEEGSHRLWLII